MENAGNPDLKNRALEIVLNLDEAPESERTERINKACGGDTALRVEVQRLLMLHDVVEEQGFLERPALDGLGSSVQFSEPETPGSGSVSEQKQSADSQSSCEDAQSQSSSHGASGSTRRTERFQRRYKLAEGGQGEVWLAFDTRLGRHVALKEIRSGLRGSSDSVSGFRNEAKLTGELEHPNIVAVYEAEHMQDSDQPTSGEETPFYVMRVFGNRHLMKAISEFYARPRTAAEHGLLEILKTVQQEPDDSNRNKLRSALEEFPFDEEHACDVQLREALTSYLNDPQTLDGCSLHDAIRELHAKPWSAASERTLRDLLRRFVDVCNAIAYAHDHGLMHRDLKPRNVMLGSFGETLVVDWGLARVVDKCESPAVTAAGLRSADRPANATAAGDIKGTPAYMPPEQASGDIEKVGPRSDIYSLGAILYALLTGRPPVIGDTTSQILNRVCNEQLSTPRDHNPQVTKPLEAVCLKALSKEPKDRYSTAQDLADDIERWLDDEPVTAWPEPLGLRLRRWIKRHQTIVVSTAAAAVVAAVISSSLLSIVAGQKSELQEAYIALKKANTNEARQREDAIRQRNAAIAAQEMAISNANVARSQTNLALDTIETVVVDLNHGLERIPAAGELRRTVLNTAFQSLERIADEFTDTDRADRQTLVAMLSMVDVILRVGITTEMQENHSASGPDSPLVIAQNLCDRAVIIADRLLTPDPDDGKALNNLAAALDSQGSVRLRAGQFSEAIDSFTRSQQVVERIVAARKGKDRVILIVPYQKLGDAYLQKEELHEAASYYRKALEVLEALAKASPEDWGIRRPLSGFYQRLGAVEFSQGNVSAARSWFEKQFPIDKEYLDLHPHDPSAQYNMVISLTKLGDVSLREGATAQAEEYFQQALSIAAQLSKDSGRDSKVDQTLSVVYLKLGELSLQRKKLDDAFKYFRGDLAISERLAANYPGDDGIMRGLAVSYEKLGMIEIQRDNPSTAMEWYKKALAIAQKRLLTVSGGRDVEARMFLSRVFGHLVDSSLKTGALEEAVEYSRKSVELMESLAESRHANATVQRGLFIAYKKCGEALLKQGNSQEAAEYFKKDIEIARRLASESPDDAQAQHDLAYSYYSIGDMLQNELEFDLAIENYRHAARVLEHMVATGQFPDQSRQETEDVNTRIRQCELEAKATGDMDALLDQSLGLRTILLSIRCELFAKHHRTEDVAMAADKLKELAEDAPPKATGPLALVSSQKLRRHNMLFYAARGYALCAASVAEEDEAGELTQTETAERREYIDLALLSLKEAVSAGFDDFEQARQHPDLSVLHQLPEFVVLFPPDEAPDE